MNHPVVIAVGLAALLIIVGIAFVMFCEWLERDFFKWWK